MLIFCSIDKAGPARLLHSEMLLCFTRSVQAVMCYSLIQNVKYAADRTCVVSTTLKSDKRNFLNQQPDYQNGIKLIANSRHRNCDCVVSARLRRRDIDAATSLNWFTAESLSLTQDDGGIDLQDRSRSDV